MKRSGLSTAAAAVSTLTCAITQAAFAQTAAPQKSILAPEEVVVTARRAAERAQTAPVSVTAFTGATLRRKSILKTADLMFSTPGVYLSGSGGRENSVYEIRGQSKALSGTNAAAVVAYFADVPQPIFGSSVDIYDMSNVQVLKGPQGTLFGRNTTGGAVLFYPTAPTYTPNGYIQVGYGNYNDRQVEGAVTIPLIQDKATLRIAGQYDERDGYTKNIGAGGPLDDTNIKAFRATLRLDPTEWLKNVTTFDTYTNNYTGDAAQLDSLDPNFSLIDLLGIRQSLENTLAFERQYGYQVTNSDVLPARNDTRRTGITNRTDAELFDGISLTNIFGYRRTFVSYNINTDGTPAEPSAVYGLPITVLNAGAINHTEQYTEELQLKGKLWDGKINWLLGAFYLSGDPYGVTGTGLGLGQPILSAGSVPSPLATFSYNNAYETSHAVFGNANFDLGDYVQGLRFDAGLRFTYDREKSCTANDTTTQGTVEPADCVASNPLLINPTYNSANSHAPTWQFGFDWRVNKSLFAYISTRRGYREGGINSPTLGGLLTPFQTFGAEKVTDVELGLKTDYTIGNVKTRFNIAIFDGYYDGVQVPLSGLLQQPGCIAGNPIYGKPPYTPTGLCNPNQDPNSGTLLANVGQSRVDGIDFDGNIAPIDNLILSFGGNILDPETTSFTAPSVLSYYITNKQIPFNMVAKATVNAGFQYAVPLGDAGSLLASGNFYYTTKVFFTQIYLNPYSVTNFRLDWNHIYGKTVDLSLYINNAFNRHYEAIGAVTGSSLGFNSAIWGPPQMYGFQLRYEFGGQH